MKDIRDYLLEVCIFAVIVEVVANLFEGLFFDVLASSKRLLR